MKRDDEVKAEVEERPRGTGLFRTTLLFGVAAIVLSLVLAPTLDRKVASLNERMAPAIDMLTTGSISKTSATHRYQLRRSVLQQPGTPACTTGGVASGLEARC